MKKIFFVNAMLILMALMSGCKEKEVTMISEELYGPAETVAVMTLTANEASSESTDEQTQEVIPPHSEETGEVVVHICGAVLSPGVYELIDGTRVSDAVLRAGGLAVDADLSYTNLATRLKDGEKIYIPTQAEVLLMKESNIAIPELEEQLQAEKDQAGKNESGRVNINTADVSELCTLSGIGQSRAESIIAYRTEHGSFQRIEDIMNISGIKDASFQKIKDQICVQD